MKLHGHIFECAGYNEDIEIINGRFNGSMVYFMKYHEPQLPAKPMCLGVFIEADKILLTTYCANELQTFREKPYDTFMLFGGNFVRYSGQGSTVIVGKQQVDPLSKFSIVFLNAGHPSSQPLGLLCLEPNSIEGDSFQGFLVGWKLGVGTFEYGYPRVARLTFKFDPQIQLVSEIGPSDRSVFAEGSILVFGEQIVALANHFGGNRVLFNPITPDDKLIIDKMLTKQEKSNGEGTSQDDNSKSGIIEQIGFYNIMVSLWKGQDGSESSELICLGILIRPNRIFVTTPCAKGLLPFELVKMKFGGNAVQNIPFKEANIIDQENVPTRSKFSILNLDSNIILPSSLELGYVNLASGPSRFYDGKLVDWDKQNERPRTMDYKIRVNTKVWLDVKDRKKKLNIVEGSVIVIDGKIVALHSNDHCRSTGTAFKAIKFEDKLKVDGMFELEDESNREVQVCQQDYENVIVIFWKNFNTKWQKIVGLGALINTEWVLITGECFNNLTPFRHITAAVGSTLTKIDIVGYQKLDLDGKFHILVLASKTELTSEIKMFFTDIGKKRTFAAKLIGRNEQGLVVNDYTLDSEFKTNIPLNGQNSLSNFHPGSILVRSMHILAFTRSHGTSTIFERILFQDYLFIQQLIHGEKPQNMIPLEGSEFKSLCKRPKYTT